MYRYMQNATIKDRKRKQTMPVSVLLTQQKKKQNYILYIRQMHAYDEKRKKKEMQLKVDG